MLVNWFPVRTRALSLAQAPACAGEHVPSVRALSKPAPDQHPVGARPAGWRASEAAPGRAANRRGADSESGSAQGKARTVRSTARASQRCVSYHRLRTARLGRRARSSPGRKETYGSPGHGRCRALCRH
jgi:hypothetical protein